MTAVVWSGPLFAATGYGDDARQLVLGLDALGVPVRVAPLVGSGVALADLAPDEAARLLALAARLRPAGDERLIGVVHAFGPHLRRLPDAAYHIGRTMFETDRLPDDWVAPCNQMDEVWVPSAFNVESFARSGVAREKLIVVPGAVDTARYRLGLPPLPLEGRRGFAFLSVFDWTWRKGWDVLLRAFVEEFGPQEDVCLVLKVWSSAGRTLGDLRAQATDELRAAGLAAALPPNVLLYEDHLPADELPRLYRAADAFVLPTRGEGWGRPLIEAMAAGLPTIATRWSAHLEFMRDDNAYLIDCQVVDVPKRAWLETPAFLHHRWAEPSVAHLRRLMRRVFEERAEARRKGQAAREHVHTHFSRERVAGLVAERLRAIGERLGHGPHLAAPSPAWEGGARGGPHPPSPSPPAERGSEGVRLDRLAIVWEGGQFVYHSLALVNRELCLGMIAAGHELSLLPTGAEQFGPEADPRFAALAARVRAPLGRPPDVHLRHGWPPDFVPPPAGRWLMIQPWEYGVVPHDWVDPIERLVDEVWVPSSYVRAAFIAGGVSPERVAVVPNGVDLQRFRPDAPPRALPTARRCKLLFVGGTVLWRKGVDVLLKAYRAAFSRRDDVCLILKDIGRGRLYSGDISGLLEPFQRDPEAPELLYLTDTIGEAEMPGLYTACDALVLPFRGEGYGLPVAEALACGRPVIVTRGGACDDFCPDAATYWIPAQRASCALPWATARPAWVLEPDVAALAEHLRAVYERPAEARARGQAGAAHARRALGWDQAIRAALARLDELRRQPPRRERTVFIPGGAPRAAELTKAEAVKALHLARAHARSRHWQAAARALARALDLDPDLAAAHHLRAEVEMQRGALDRAVAAARRAVALAPESADFQTTLGAMLQASGDRRGAEAAYHRALALDGRRGEVWQALAALYAEEGREAEARAAGERAAALGAPTGAAPSGHAEANARAALVAAQAHVAAGRWDEAVSALNRALDLDPLLVAAHYLLGCVALQRGALDEAVGALRQAAALAPGEADVQSALGVALHLAGDQAGAEAALRRAVAADAARGDVWGNLGELYEAQERWAEAAVAYERAGALGDERGAPGAARARGRLARA